MPWADTALTAEIEDAVADVFGIDATGGERLHGGEESATFRVRDHVVRIGPSWRTDAELDWCYAVAHDVANEVPEVVPPIRSEAGRGVIRVQGLPVTFWPFVDGGWLGDPDHDDIRDAAGLV